MSLRERILEHVNGMRDGPDRAALRAILAEPEAPSAERMAEVVDHNGPYPLLRWFEAAAFLPKGTTLYATPPSLSSATPMAWARIHPDGTPTGELLPHALVEPVRRASGAWLPLYPPSSVPTSKLVAEIMALGAGAEGASRELLMAAAALQHEQDLRARIAELEREPRSKASDEQPVSTDDAPFCRDCADADGTCPHSGARCDGGVDDDAVERALHARVPGGAEVWHWLPTTFDKAVHDTARNVMRTALAAAWPELQRRIAEMAAERDAQSRAYGLLIVERDAAVKREQEAAEQLTEAWIERDALRKDAEAVRERGWVAGYYCAVAALLRDAGAVTVDVRTLFGSGACDLSPVDAGDLALFREHGLMDAVIAEQKAVQESSNGP